MTKYRLRRPVLVVLTATITAGVTLNLPAAEAETPTPAGTAGDCDRALRVGHTHLYYRHGRELA